MTDLLNNKCVRVTNTNSVLLTLVLDVGVVFTERKEYGGGVKQPAAETTGRQSHIAPSPISHPTQQTTPSQPLSSTIKEETSPVSRPTRRHERNLSQATNIFMGVMPAEGKPDAKAEIQKAIEEEAPTEGNVGPYNERRQFWETVTTQSFESKGSDTDTVKTEGTIVETKKDSMTEEEYLSQRADPAFYENEAFDGTDKIDFPNKAEKDRCVSPFEVVRSYQSETSELPSPEDVAFKDVTTKREIFEKEIKRQSMEFEETQSWKRSSKEYDDKVIVAEESESYVHEENRSKHDIEQKSHEVLKDDKSIIKEKYEMEKKTKEENKTKIDSKVTSSETVTEVNKKTLKKSDEVISSQEKTENIEATKLYSDEIVKQNKGIIHTELSSTKLKESNEEKLIREEKKEVKIDSHSKIDITKKEAKFESRSESSSKAKQVFQTELLDSHDISQDEVTEDDITRFEETSDEEQDEVPIKPKPTVEQKVTEESRVIGDSHETTVRETTTTRSGDAEERVIKETKTLETFMADGSTVKSTSITTFTTQLDKQDSEDLSDDSVSKEEKDSVESLKDTSLELKTTNKSLTSPIKVPEEKVQDVVWEVSQERSDEVVSETVQDIPSHEPITHHSVKDVAKQDDEDVKKVQLSEEEARKLAIEIVEEVKSEAIKRSPLVTPSQSVQGFKDTDFQTPGPKSEFTIETSSKIEKYIQEKLSEEVDENALRLIESVAAKKSEILQKKLQGKHFQISMDITDEDLRSSGAELSPVEHHMERLRQMTEDERLRYPREPSEADESEGSMIIHETLEEDDASSEYNQATEMIDKTLDAVKVTDLANSGKRIEHTSKVDVITEEVSEQINLSNSEVTETARQIVKEVTEKAQESEAVKLASLDTKEKREQRGSGSLEHSRTPSPHSSRKGSWMDDEELRREFRRDYEDKKKMFKLTSDKEDNVFDDEVVIKTSEVKEVLKESTKDFHDIIISHQKSEESLSHSQTHMESSMTESMEESSAAESSRYFEGKMRSEITVIKEGKESESDRRSSSSCEEVIMRNKFHKEEFKRKSGTDFDANSTSSSSEKGESPYFTAGEGTSDSRSISRPCSSDVEALMSGTTGTSDYDTACTSQDTSQRSTTSQEYQTAASSLSSRDSMKSVDSESSGNLGSIELSETSETLVPSAMELERDMDLLDQEELLEEERIIAGHSQQKIIPQLTIQSETPVSEDSPSPFGVESEGEIDSDSKDDDIRTTSKMKRSIEMTFHPEPTSLRESTKTVPVRIPSSSKNDSVASSLEESTVSEVSDTTVIEKSQGESSDTNMTVSSVSEQLASSIEYVEESDQQVYRTDSSVLTTESGSSGIPHSVTITATSVQTSMNNQKTATMCTQVTSETRNEIEETEKTESERKQFFRVNGPTEVDYMPEYDDESVQSSSQWPVVVPAVSQNASGATAGPSEGPDKVASTEESCETEADQEYGQMIREGDFSELAEAELQYTMDDQPESDMSSMLAIDEPIERPKTPEPGYVPPPTLTTQITIDSTDDPEEFTEVDKRFSAVFSMTYEEREEGARSLGYSSMSVDIPDITISEHTAPTPNKYCYPDLEREEDFPECRALAEAQEKSSYDIPGTPGSQESASTGASRKSSTTDSEQGQEYCLDDVMKGQDYSDYGSFEMVGVDDIIDSSEYERTLNIHEERMMQMSLIKEEDEEEMEKNKNNTSPVEMPSQLKAIRIEKKEPPEALVIDDEEFVPADETIEEKKRWLELLFEEELIAEESRKAAYDYQQHTLIEHVYSGPLEDIEEEREDAIKRDHSQAPKPSSLTSTPEYDVLAGRKFFTRSGDQDDISINSLQSLQDFEILEKEIAVDGITRKSSGSQESLNGKKFEGKSGQGDDISIGSFSSLSEFEKLEQECVVVEDIEKKAKLEEAMLSEIEEGHESQVSESESCETLSDVGQGSVDGDDYEERMFEIDEIIRQAQNNVEGFNKKGKTRYDGVRLRDIVGSGSADATESSLIDRTASFGRDSLEDAQVPELEFDTSSSKAKGISVKVSRNSDIMTISSDSIEESKSMARDQSQDSLEKLIAPLTGCGDMTTSADSIEFTSKQDPMTISTDSLDEKKRKLDPMSISTDSIDPARRDMMTTSVDSLGRDDSSGRDADISSGSEQIGRRIGPDGIMECSIDSLGGVSLGDPSSSQATHAMYQYDTDSMMSSFTSGCSNTLVQSGEETGDIMTSSMYLTEGELPSEINQRHVQYIQTGAGTMVESVTDSNEPGFSRTVHRMVQLPPEAHQVTFTGPDAQKKLADYMDRFNAGEDSIEEERVDEHGNMHTRRVVQKRILVDPTEATHFGISSSDPNVKETEEVDKHGNVTRIVKRTVVTTETVEVDLDTGEPIVKPKQTIDSSFTSSHQSSPSRVSRIPRPTSHVAGPTSHVAVPQPPPGLPLEPNTVSGSSGSQK